MARQTPVHKDNQTNETTNQEHSDIDVSDNPGFDLLGETEEYIPDTNGIFGTNENFYV